MSVLHSALDSPVIESLVVVVAGVAALVVAVWIVQRWATDPSWRRMLWRAALVTSVVWTVAEVLGGNMMVARWMVARSEVAASAKHDDQPSTADERVEVSSVPARVDYEPLTPEEGFWNALPGALPDESIDLVLDLSTQVDYSKAPSWGREPISPPVAATQNTLAAKETPDPVPFGTLFFVAFLAGSVALALWFFGRRIVVVWFTWRHTSLAPEAIVELVSSHLAPRDEASSRGARRLRCVESPRLTAPVVYGVLRPTLAVPVGFADALPPDQLHAVLAHELVHISGRDALWQAAFDAFVVLVWWHPLVWLARSQHRSACEAAADAGAAAIDGGPRALAAALVRLARHAANGPRLGWAALEKSGKRRSRLGRRVLRLLREDFASRQSTLGRRGTVFVTVIVGLLITSLLFGTALARRHVPRHTYDSGENPMTILQTSWRSSLAAAAIAAMLGTSYADEAEESEEAIEAELALDLDVDVDELGVDAEDALELLVELQPEAEAELVLANEEEGQAEAERLKAIEKARINELILSQQAKAKQAAATAQAKQKDAMTAQELAMAKKKLAQAQAELARARDQVAKQVAELEAKAKSEAALGRIEAAARITEQARKIRQLRQGDRIRIVEKALAEGNPAVTVVLANEAMRRRHHLIEAIENLRAIGKNDLADELMEEAEAIDPDAHLRMGENRFGIRFEPRGEVSDNKQRRQMELEIHRQAVAAEDMARQREAEARERGGAVNELRAEMNELRSQVNDMRAMLEKVVERLERDEQRGVE